MYGIEKRDLLKKVDSADSKSAAVSASVIRKVRRLEPVRLRQAQLIVLALSAVMKERDSATKDLHPDEEVIGAFFALPKLESLVDETRDVLNKQLLASQARVEASVLDDIFSGKRVTLPTALSILRALKIVRASKKLAFIDPREVIVTSHKAGKKAAAKKYLVERTRYEIWPPKELLPEDREGDIPAAV